MNRMPEINVSLDVCQDAWVDVDDIYNALSKEEKIQLFWWLLEDVFNDVEDQLKDWFEDEE